MFTRLNAAIAANDLQPVIDRTFPPRRPRSKPSSYLQSAQHFGKVVLSLQP